MTIPNLYTPNNIGLKYIKQIFTQTERKIEPQSKWSILTNIYSK